MSICSMCDKEKEEGRGKTKPYCKPCTRIWEKAYRIKRKRKKQLSRVAWLKNQPEKYRETCAFLGIEIEEGM